MSTPLMTTNWSATALGLALLTPLAPCQSITSVDAPQALLQPLNLRNGTVQNLALPVVPGAPFRVDVVLAGAQRTLVLRPFDIRSMDFQLLVDDGKSLRQLPTPASVTYRGTVSGMAETIVAAALIDGQLQAAVHTRTDTWWIQPASDTMPGLPRGMHVVARNADTFLPGRCGVGEHAPHTTAPQGPVAPPSNALKIAEVAIDVTNPAYIIMGSNTTSVNNRVTSVLNIVDSVFTRDVEILKTVTAIIIRTTQVYQSTGTNLLGLVQTRWTSLHANIRRDLTHAFGGTPPGSILGIANISAVCTNRHYGVTWWWGPLNGQADIMAHEMGHNWSALHCDNNTPCWTMCSGNVGCSAPGILKFAPVSVQRILNFKNTRTCLSNPVPPLLGGISPASVTSHQPGQVTLTGVGLDRVASLTVGGTQVPIFTINGSTSITFTPPSPFEIKTHAVIATALGIPSNPVNLTVTGNHPSVYITQTFAPRGFNIDYTLHTDRQWLGTLFLSSLNTPSSFPPIVVMEIGGNFSNLIQVATVAADATGFAKLMLNWPTSIAPQTFFSEFVTYSLSATLPLETSNAAATTLF